MLSRTVAVLMLMMANTVSIAEAFPKNVAVADHVLNKVAEARYSLVWKRITDVALYVDSDQTVPAGSDILHADYIKYLTIEYGVSVSAERFEKMSRDLINDNWPAKMVSEQKDSINAFCGWLKNVKSGDRYSVYWIPEQGLSLALNDKVQGTLTNPVGAQVILSLWLGRAAVSASQRDVLLEQWRLKEAQVSK
jgi:hypothetical protein